MKLRAGELAQALGVTKQTVSYYARTQKISPDASGLYDLETVRKQLAENLGVKRGGHPRRGEAQPPAAAPPPRAVPAPKEPDRFGGVSRQDLEKARLAELVRRQKRQNDLEDRRLVNAEKAAFAWAEIGSKFSAAVMGLTPHVCNRLPAEWRRTVAPVLEDECRRLLLALADDIRSTPKAA